MQKISRIEVLDGYRALAILLVLFFHYTVRWAFPYDPANHFPWGALFNGDAVALYGGFGVEFFFVISGFVILMTLEKCTSILDFAVRRFARLWPSLIVAATLTTVAMPFIGFPEWRVTLPSYLASIFLAPPWVIGHFLHEKGLSWVDGAYWSLFVEIQFYALACFCYWLTRKSFVRLWIVLQACVTALTIMASHSHSLAAFSEELVFFPYFPYFTIGICLYKFYRGGAPKNQAIGGAILAAVTVLMSSALKWNIWEHYSATGNIVTNVLIFTFFILFALESRLVNIFAWRPIAVLGQASYALYLLHQFIGVSLMRVLVMHGIPYLASMLMVATGIICFSVLIFNLVENPAKRLLLTRLHPWVSETQNNVPWIRFGRTSPLARVSALTTMD